MSHSKIVERLALSECSKHNDFELFSPSVQRMSTKHSTSIVHHSIILRMETLAKGNERRGRKNGGFMVTQSDDIRLVLPHLSTVFAETNNSFNFESR